MIVSVISQTPCVTMETGSTFTKIFHFESKSSNQHGYILIILVIFVGKS